MATTKLIVADAGPLIHLAELSALDLLFDLGEITVPPRVLREVLIHRPHFDSSALRVVEPVPVIDERWTRILNSSLIHSGERKALLLCYAEASPFFLTDDMAARSAAEKLGIQAQGSVGIIVRSVRRGTRTLEGAIEILQSIPRLSTLHIRQSLLDRVIAELR